MNMRKLIYLVRMTWMVISRDWCKNIVTASFYVRSYTSFAPSPHGRHVATQENILKNRPVPGRLSNSRVICQSLKSYGVSLICDYRITLVHRVFKELFFSPRKGFVLVCLHISISALWNIAEQHWIFWHWSMVQLCKGFRDGGSSGTA